MPMGYNDQLIEVFVSIDQDLTMPATDKQDKASIYMYVHIHIHN